MECIRVKTRGEELMDPRGAVWAKIAGEELKMAATPLANQPSEYIKASRDERKVGKVKRLTVQAAHNGEEIFFRLRWPDENKSEEVLDTTEFADGCGILMPLHGGDPAIDEMGSKDNPVNAWYWRADFADKARNVVARGLSTTEYTERCAVKVRSSWQGAEWAVVFGRPLAVAQQEDETVQLAAGTAVQVGFAVWEGSNGERGGVKSFSKEWRELRLES